MKSWVIYESRMKKKEDLKRRDKNWTTEAPTKNI